MLVWGKIAVLLGVMLVVPAAAGALCLKQNWVGSLTVDDRICKINTIIDDWLLRYGIDVNPMNSTSQSVATIGSTLDSKIFFERPVIRPRAEVAVRYFVNSDEGFKLAEMTKFRPGLMKEFVTMMTRKAPDIFCNSVSESEDFFISAGGEVIYTIELRPRSIVKGMRTVMAQVTFAQSSCEVS